MTAEATRLLERIAERVKDDPAAMLPTLRVLAGEPPYPAGHRRGKGDLHAVALEINRARVQADRAEFLAHSWPTDRVAQHLGVTSRQAVAQRRQRGGLLGARIGNQTYYPDWQFGPAGLAEGLDDLLSLLRDAGVEDCREADDVLRMQHSELGGKRLLDVWRKGDWTTLEVWLGDVAGWRR